MHVGFIAKKTYNAQCLVHYCSWIQTKLEWEIVRDYDIWLKKGEEKIINLNLHVDVREHGLWQVISSIFSFKILRYFFFGKRAHVLITFCCCCCSWFLFLYLEAIVGPATELHVAVLVVEGEPGDVDLAGGLEYPRRDVSAATVAVDHHIGGICTIKRLIGTGQNWTEEGKVREVIGRKRGKRNGACGTNPHWLPHYFTTSHSRTRLIFLAMEAIARKKNPQACILAKQVLKFLTGFASLTWAGLTVTFFLGGGH